MKIVVAEKHKQLTDFILQLPEGNYPVEEVIRDSRNTVTKVSAAGKAYIVKQYIRPRFYNRIAYTFLRKSKARRSYEYALELQKRGIGTADPVAYMEIRKNGLFHTGFFISEFVDEPLLEDIEEYTDKEQILNDFAQFTADLHRQGIVHHDYNPTNILFRKENGQYRFYMLDINRMNFRKELSREQCLNSLRRMGLEIDNLIRYIQLYAQKREWQTEYVLGYFFKQRSIFLKKRRKKNARKERKAKKNK